MNFPAVVRNPPVEECGVEGVAGVKERPHTFPYIFPGVCSTSSCISSRIRAEYSSP